MNRSARIVMVVPLLAIAYLVYEFAHPPWTALRVAGLVILASGITLLTVARIQLADSFSVSPQAKQLVTHGIYSRIRNPIYIFSTIVFAGLFLYLDVPYLFLSFLFLIPLQFFRARAEAGVLEEHFGEEYRQYRAKTWF